MDTKKCIAELQWVKEYGFFLDRNMPGVDDIIEALEEGIQALRKQIPREPIEKQVHLNSWHGDTKRWVCPTCGSLVEVDDNECYATEYYPTCKCGQRIEWNNLINDYEMKWNDEV